MRIDDIRGKFHDPFLYKRFAYNSDGFIELMKFLEDENLLDDFCKECNFKQSYLLYDLEVDKKDINLWDFFASSFKYSFPFMYSKKGNGFWVSKIFYNKKFEEIKNKLL